jgi:hypothetical protein
MANNAKVGDTVIVEDLGLLQECQLEQNPHFLGSVDIWRSRRR